MFPKWFESIMMKGDCLKITRKICLNESMRKKRNIIYRMKIHKKLFWRWCYDEPKSNNSDSVCVWSWYMLRISIRTYLDWTIRDENIQWCFYTKIHRLFMHLMRWKLFPSFFTGVNKLQIEKTSDNFLCTSIVWISSTYFG